MNEIQFVDLKRQYLSIKTEIDQAINRVLTETAFIGGKYVENFENEFSKLYQVNHCIPVGNGTDSLFIIMKMLGISQGDEVITSAYSWISSSEAISLTGAKPIFVDIDRFYSIDADRIEQHINSKTKAILVVHIHGQMCDMDKIMALAQKYDLKVIEDCAQSHFSEYSGKLAGTIGIAGSFSFYPGKNLGAYGDAGCIITNDIELAMKCKMFANHGALTKHQHKIEGINSRLDGLQASILSAKMEYIKAWTEKRRELALYYNSKLISIKELELPLVRPNTNHSYHLYVIKCDQRDALKAYLKEQGIETVIHYPKCLPNLECYTNGDKLFPIATDNESKILSLPIYPELKHSEIDYISKKIVNFYSNES